MQLHQLHDSYEITPLNRAPVRQLCSQILSVTRCKISPVVRLVRIVPLVWARLQCDQVVSIGQSPWGNGEFLYKIATFSKSQKNWGERPVPEGEAGGRGPPRNFEYVFSLFRFFFFLRFKLKRRTILFLRGVGLCNYRKNLAPEK